MFRSSPAILVAARGRGALEITFVAAEFDEEAHSSAIGGRTGAIDEGEHSVADDVVTGISEAVHAVKASGIDFRLTDVHGRVVGEILA